MNIFTSLGEKIVVDNNITDNALKKLFISKYPNMQIIRRTKSKIYIICNVL